MVTIGHNNSFQNNNEYQYEAASVKEAAFSMRLGHKCFSLWKTRTNFPSKRLSSDFLFCSNVHLGLGLSSG
jgi:hypothetical protein